MGNWNKRTQGNLGERGSKNGPKVYFSFKYLDISQGQSLRQWSTESNLLLKLMEKISQLSKLTYSEAVTNGIIQEYDVENTSKFSAKNMPRSSSWRYPITLKDKNVKWVKIRLGSTRRIIGFMAKNIFYVVFLDKDHEFYPTEPHNS